MIRLEPHPHGVILPIRALPGAKRACLRGEQEGMLKVAVTQVAEKGKANQAILLVLSKALGLRKSQLELIAGETAAPGHQRRVLQPLDRLADPFRRAGLFVHVQIFIDLRFPARG